MKKYTGTKITPIIPMFSAQVNGRMVLPLIKMGPLLEKLSFGHRKFEMPIRQPRGVVKQALETWICGSEQRSWLERLIWSHAFHAGAGELGFYFMW